MILQQFDTPFGLITITREPDGTRSYRQKDTLQSAVNKDGISTCAYVHALFSLLQQTGSKRISMIGCAGGTLATMLHKTGCEVTVVDLNPFSFTVARQFFGMPAAIDCVVQEGSDFIAKTTRSYDAIVIDAFSNDGMIPQQFITEDFFMNVKVALAPDGIALMNVITLHDFDRRAHHVASHMRASGLAPILFDRPGAEHRNTIIAGGLPDHVKMPSGKEPSFIQPKLARFQRVRSIR